MKTTMQIAQQLAALCREGQEAFDALYAADAVSVEAAEIPGMGREVRGIEALKAKSARWYAEHELHSATVTGPWPHGDRFILGFAIDVTQRSTGQRVQMDDMALYTVADGKIVREEFFYPTGP
jgi:ketosteroid isomerase-like protein